MKNKKKKNRLFDPERFKWMNKDRDEFLKNLTEEQSIKLLEEFLSSKMFDDLIKDNFEDNPVFLKICLKNKNVR